MENNGLEPLTPCVQSRCSKPTELIPPVAASAAAMPCHFGYVFTETGGGVVPPPRQRPKGQASPTRALPRLSWKTWLNSAPPDSPGLHPQSRAGSRKEVFQPHLPVRLPCYDLAPVTRIALGRSSSVADFRHPGLPWLDGRCVQGPGTYSPRHG